MKAELGRLAAVAGEAKPASARLPNPTATLGCNDRPPLIIATKFFIINESAQALGPLGCRAELAEPLRAVHAPAPSRRTPSIVFLWAQTTSPKPTFAESTEPHVF